MVAIEARVRHTGLPPDLASHEQAGTALGRLWLRGEITAPMREAGERYLELRNAALRAIKAPVGLTKSGDAGAGGDLVTEDYVAWAISAVARYEVARAWLGNRVGLIESVVIDDRECQPYEVPLLADALTYLAQRMGIILVHPAAHADTTPARSRRTIL